MPAIECTAPNNQIQTERSVVFLKQNRAIFLSAVSDGKPVPTFPETAGAPFFYTDTVS